jgi:succinate dehydrogenase/fumarate reductase cytochrome b subunit
MDLFSTNIAYASVDTFINKVDTLIINPLITLLFALAMVYFLYGVFEFIANQENEEKKTSGKNHMLWGLIGITIMMGVWTILGII